MLRVPDAGPPPARNGDGAETGFAHAFAGAGLPVVPQVLASVHAAVSAADESDPDPEVLPDEAAVQVLSDEACLVTKTVPVGSSSAFAQYLSELQRYPLLTPDEEIRIARRARRGEVAAREQLVRHNLRFVVAIARRSAAHGMSIEDLVQEGNFGLMRAVLKFDPARGVKFVSYAVHWIQQSIRASLASQQRTVYLPVSRASQLGRINRTRSRLAEILRRPPSLQELADHTGVPLDMVQTLVRVGQGELSLDGPPLFATNDTVTALSDRIGQPSTAEHAMQRDDRQRIVHHALRGLRARDAEVVRLAYGLAGGREYTLEEIGLRLGITRERVRQVRDRALHALRQHPQAALLRDYLHLDVPSSDAP